MAHNESSPLLDNRHCGYNGKGQPFLTNVEEDISVVVDQTAPKNDPDEIFKKRLNGSSIYAIFFG